ncbi:unnamed protein product [Mucor fragilis]
MMDNPNSNQQESMNLKAAKMAYQLVESTERFLNTAGKLNLGSIRAMGSDINDHINRVIQQYEHVCMIVNALKAISLCVSDPHNRNSLVTAATSASTSSSTALSRIYSQFSSLQLDDSVARESLSQLALLVPQSKLVNTKPEERNSSNVSTMPLQICHPPSPPTSTQDIDNERRELALKRKQFDEEREEFEREKKRLLLDKESIDEKLKEQQSNEQEQQRRMFEKQQVIFDKQRQVQLLQSRKQQEILKQQQEQLNQQQQERLQQEQQQQERLKQQERLQQERLQQERLQQQQQDKLKQQEQLKQQQLLKQQQQDKWKQQQQHLQLQQQRHEQRISESKKSEQAKDQSKQQQDKENLAKQRQQVHVLSTDQFLEQFEKTAQTFAQSVNMDIDNVWESMLIHALPKDKIPWAKEAIIGKKHSWRYAKHMYYKKYADNANNTSAPSSPTGPAAVAVPSFSIPTASTAAFAATNAAVQATASASTNNAIPATGAPAVTTIATINAPLSPLQRLLARPAPSATDPPSRERDQRRVADYCQHLLSLEMKFYDTIEEYNKRYMRYCTIANVDLTGKSFIDRYIRSLDPKYRGIVRTALQLHRQPLNHIKDVMAVAEETINAYIAVSPARNNAPYSQNCIHNRKVNQTV